MAWSSVEYAKSRGLIVELSGEDASRADQHSFTKYIPGEWNAGQTGSVSATRWGFFTPKRSRQLSRRLPA
jgi:D-citramalate synthase